MIHFNRTHWWSPVFVFFGGILPLLISRGLLYLAYLFSAYAISVYAAQYGYELVLVEATGGLHLSVHVVSFLLVFRLHQANDRYRDGLYLTAEMFSNLNQLMTLTVTSLNGSHGRPLQLKALGTDAMKHDTHAELAICVKVHAVRLCLAFAVAFKVHCHMAEAQVDGGEIPEDCMVRIIFGYLRLKGLLYSKEQAYLDECFSIFEESIENAFGLGKCCCTGPCSCSCCDFQDDKHYYCEMNKYRSSEERRGPHAFFEGNESDDNRSLSEENYETDGRAMNPLPLIVMQFLRDALNQAVSQPWGYPERTLNLIEFHIGKVLVCFGQLDCLIQVPPLVSYLQHCRVLLWFFALTYPMSVPVEEGLWANVTTPWLLFIALVGFEKLAERLENPVGDDDTDLNVLEFIHSLEVSASRVFELSELRKENMRKSFLRPLSGASKGALPADPPYLKEMQSQQRADFSTYFAWMPMPLQTIEYILEKAGHITSVHSVRWVEYANAFVRRLTGRAKTQDFDDDFNLTSPDIAPRKTVQALQQDRFLWYHHLCLRECHDRQVHLTRECSQQLRHCCIDMRLSFAAASKSARQEALKRSTTFFAGANMEDGPSVPARGMHKQQTRRTWYLDEAFTKLGL